MLRFQEVPRGFRMEPQRGSSRNIDDDDVFSGERLGFGRSKSPAPRWAVTVTEAFRRPAEGKAPARAPRVGPSALTPGTTNVIGAGMWRLRSDQCSNSASVHAIGRAKIFLSEI